MYKHTIKNCAFNVQNFSLSLSQVSCDLLLNLFLKYQLIVDVLTDKGGPAGKKNLMRRRLLSSSTILLFLKALFRLGK